MTRIVKYGGSTHTAGAVGIGPGNVCDTLTALVRGGIFCEEIKEGDRELDTGAATVGVELVVLGTGDAETGSAYNCTAVHDDPLLKVNLGVSTAKKPAQSVVEVS